MSQATIEIEYPESNGLPMSESDEHFHWMVWLYNLLDYRHRDDSDVYVSRNMFVYYEEGRPRRHLVPDVFVVKNCEKRSRKTFKTWVEGRIPNVVFELASDTTFRRDVEEKPEMYAGIGVPEYFVYDHMGTLHDPPLSGLRLVDGAYVPIERDANGRLHSEELGLLFELGAGGDLIVRDDDNEAILVTALEAAEAERTAQIEAVEARAKADRQAVEARAKAERQAVEARAKAVEARAERELQAKDAEIERLRRRLLEESNSNDGNES